MAILKCKMCGGTLEVQEGMSVAECEYCGTTQTVPNVDDEKKITLFKRANKLRADCYFDQSAVVYESIVKDFPEEAEAYWGILLCTYGIEYVDDPATGKKIPTCHRSSFESIMDDSNFELVMENADVVARKVYREEAKAIEEIRKGIIEISGKEEPYDIFICYKETDENGDRTIDSEIAQDVYDMLTSKGYRVFFARITLEDKLGQEYEPYIFAALNSAKLMLVFGTDYEYFNAVWVKNEWSRFLRLMGKDKSKALIPCYKNVDAYDMPKEFGRLQAQDMGKVGAMQDLMRGVEKLLDSKTSNTQKQAEQIQVVSNTKSMEADGLLKRAFIFLEDGDFAKANEYCEKVLDLDPENAYAYLGKLMVELKIQTKANLQYLQQPFADKDNYKKAIRFADSNLKSELEEYIKAINDRIKAINDCIKAEFEEQRHKWEKNSVCSLWGKRIFNKNHIIKPDGTIATIVKRKSVAEWNNIVDIKASDKPGNNLIVGLKKDGTVVAIGNNEHGQCNVYSWNNIIAIETDRLGNNTVGLKSDGTVVAVGYNEDGKCNVDDWKDIASISTGNNHTVGLKKDGTVVAVGDNYYKQCDVDDWKDIVSISTGEYHTVGLKKDGTVVAVGDNEDGQCNVDNWKDIVSISTDNNHTVGLKKDGTVVAVGYNYYKQCDVDNWKDIVAISAGYKHTVGLKSDGTVVAVGDNEYGQCNVDNWKDIASISTGDFHTVGLKKDGTVVAVGDNEYGQCNVDNWKDIIVILAGYSNTVGLKSDGTVVAVGYNCYKQCDVDDWKDIASISTSDFHTVGLKKDGTVVAVGDNKYGKCNVNNWKDIASISTSEYHTVGLKKDGTVVAVGDNEDGECNVDDWKDIVSISSNNGHTVGLKKDGTVVAVGNNYYKQCDVNNWTDIVAVSTSCRLTVGLKSNGTVVAVGDIGYGKCNVDNWKDIVSISTGAFYTVGLKKDGTVVAVGYIVGECNVDNWKDIVSISTDNNHTVGLKKDGTVVAIGDNEYGQCDISEWEDVVAISAVGNHTLGLKTDGTILIAGEDTPNYHYNPEYNILSESNHNDLIGLRNFIKEREKIIAPLKEQRHQEEKKRRQEKEKQYKDLCDKWLPLINSADTINNLLSLQKEILEIIPFSYSKEFSEKCSEKIYTIGKNSMSNATSEIDYRECIEIFSKILDYRDSRQLKEDCEKTIQLKKEQSIKEKQIAEIQSKINIMRESIAKEEKKGLFKSKKNIAFYENEICKLNNKIKEIEEPQKPKVWSVFKNVNL